MNIDALSIEVSTSAKKAAQEFEALAASMRRANAAAGRAQGMESMRRAVDGMRDALGAAGKLRGRFQLLRLFQGNRRGLSAGGGAAKAASGPFG